MQMISIKTSYKRSKSLFGGSTKSLGQHRFWICCCTLGFGPCHYISLNTSVYTLLPLYIGHIQPNLHMYHRYVDCISTPFLAYLIPFHSNKMKLTRWISVGFQSNWNSKMTGWVSTLNFTHTFKNINMNISPWSEEIKKIEKLQ